MNLVAAKYAPVPVGITSMEANPVLRSLKNLDESAKKDFFYKIVPCVTDRTAENLARLHQYFTSYLSPMPEANLMVPLNHQFLYAAVNEYLAHNREKDTALPLIQGASLVCRSVERCGQALAKALNQLRRTPESENDILLVRKLLPFAGTQHHARRAMKLPFYSDFHRIHQDAVRLCGVLSDSGPVLERVRTTHIPWLKSDAVTVLGLFPGNEEVEDVLIAALNDNKKIHVTRPREEATQEDYPYTRLNAARSLGRLKSRRALKPLENLLQREPNDDVVQAIAIAITQIEAA